MSRSWFRSLRTLIVALGLMPGLTAAADAQPFGHDNITAYGANGFDTGDDWQAIQNAVNAIPPGGRGAIYIPAGRFLLSNTLNVQGRSVEFRGEGQGISKLVWYAGWNGIQYGSSAQPDNTAQDTLTVRSLSLLRSNSSGGAAITATWPKQRQYMWHGNGGVATALIHDVHISSDPWPSPGEGSYWWFGIQLFNATTAKISVFNIHGGSDNTGVAAIQLDGAPALPDWPGGIPPPPDVNPYGKSIAVYIRDGSISKYVRGLEAKSWSEGIHFNNIDIRETSWGAWFVNRSGSTVLSNCFIQSRVRGILLEHGGITVAHSTIQQYLDTDFAGIELMNVNPSAPNEPIFGTVFTGNTIDSPGGGTQPRNGIVLNGNVDLSIVQNNTIHNMHRGIWIINGTFDAQENMVVGNLIRGWTIGGVVDGGVNTRQADNVW